jgi:hypothetical protein
MRVNEHGWTAIHWDRQFSHNPPLRDNDIEQLFAAIEQLFADFRRFLR